MTQTTTLFRAMAMGRAMVVTPSQMVPLGQKAPDFALPDTEGNTVRLADFAGQPLLVIFLCNHCPYVKHVRSGIADVTREFAAHGFGIVGITSNDVDKYPDDGPDEMRLEKEDAGYAFPYLFDESQEVAKAYQAACTPDFFVYDREHRLAYRGQMDDARPGNGKPVTGSDLRAALDAVLGGGSPSSTQTPSMGCNIKWKPGNAPAYFG